MNRDQFLQKQWQAYPDLPKDRSSWWFGRVLSIGETHWELSHGGQSQSFDVIDLVQTQDPELGISVLLDGLRPGDSVAVHKDTKHIFLLAPCFEPYKITSFDEEWNQFVETLRGDFLSRGFLQIQTPFLVTSPGVDHHIDSFQVCDEGGHVISRLPTSPEIALKKKLCQGQDKIFEIKSCFRNDLAGAHHRKEFTMLEWYRAFATLEDLQQDLQSLFEKLSASFQLQLPPLKASTMSEQWRQQLGHELRPETSLAELKTLAAAQSIEWSPDDDWNDLFFRIFMEKVEPRLGLDAPLLLFNFPPQQASLAKISKEGWAQRFELYWQGVELANAYQEVNHPEENRSRFLNENHLRQSRGSKASPLDESFFTALRQGMPPSAGIALGMDRLFMLLRGQEQIHSLF
ncbi:MAG: EF-P lysine aminoacylase GenX [Bdellovibrionales bacterium]|nr:EF-P lysine aminoacylase GenX [Bdellovibrionales bacterium]